MLLRYKESLALRVSLCVSATHILSVQPKLERSEIAKDLC